MIFQQSIKISTLGRGTSNITRQVNELISQSGITKGLANIFVHHTSASLILSNGVSTVSNASEPTTNKPNNLSFYSKKFECKK